MSSPDKAQSLHRFDRHLRLATALTGEPTDVVVRKFVHQRVLLTGDPRRVKTPSGQVMLATASNMIARFCPKIDIVAEFGQLADETIRLLKAIDASQYRDFRVVETPDYESYAAVLSIGTPPKRTEKTIAIDAREWLALFSRDGVFPPGADPSHRNPFGALMAVALGAAEVFKHLLKIRPERGAHFGPVAFSTYSYSVNDEDPGPALPDVVALPPSLLAGVGAVGNAMLLALSHVPGVDGDMIVVDQQVIDDESNLNRYLLAVEADADAQCPTPKTQLAIRLFAGRRLRIQGFQEPLKQFLGRIYQRTIERPSAVLSAVDNNEAREVLQKLWPTLLLEGATDNTTSQVSRHEYAQGLACLLCIHTIGQVEGGTNFSYEEHAAALSGLARERIQAAARDASIVVTAEDVERALGEKREMLARNVGRPVCSVLAELEGLSARPAEELPVQPAVSFVSMIAGLLLAAELVKHAADLGSPLETFFQMDSMYPLANAILQPVEKVKTCYCVTRAGEIREYRRMVGEG